MYFIRKQQKNQGIWKVMLIQSDYHIHATFYRIKKAGDDPGPTAAEQLAAAREAGCVYTGIVEHCNESPKHPFSCLEELAKEFYAPDFPRENVFFGVEADLADDGSDHCGKEGREKLKLNYVIGSVHLDPKRMPDFETYLATEYKRITNALKYNDNVDVIGHPFGEGRRWAKNEIIPRWGWDLIPDGYLDEILHLAKETGKALEVNRCDFEDPVYLDFLARVRDEKIFFEVGSDAHGTKSVVNSTERTKALEKLDFQEEYHWKPFK